MHKFVVIGKDDVKTERCPFRGERFQIQDVARAAERLESVDVDDDRKIAQMMVPGKERRLPCRPLVAVAFGKNAVNGEGIFRETV